MNEEELIQRMQSRRPEAPAAPACEWEAIAARIRPVSIFASLRRPALAFAGGMAVAMAMAAFVLMPQARPKAAGESAALESYLGDLSQELQGPGNNAGEAPEESYLSLLERPD
jgi:hypothetical protein